MQPMMSNTQLYLAIGLPILAVLISLAINVVAIVGIRDSIRDMRESLRELREDIREIRSDIKLLTGKVYDLMSQKS